MNEQRLAGNQVKTAIGKGQRLGIALHHLKAGPLLVKVGPYFGIFGYPFGIIIYPRNSTGSRQVGHQQAAPVALAAAHIQQVVVPG
ncbi:hypothetical protein ADICEAN_04182 [Cesiribacter andamanensis AMV16]|uniref:Uncharacterized protein n=1 Tax=Cesiribacter andamanensis AMV16 TaxID=1279009 RepID=M7N070_9BACT|nr:hypothetical protein ADICEAN_04182 [Cesiribacter andamanensis AMV16]